MQAWQLCSLVVLYLTFASRTVLSRPWEVPKVPYYNIPGVPAYDTIPQDIPGLKSGAQGYSAPPASLPTSQPSPSAPPIQPSPSAPPIQQSPSAPPAQSPTSLSPSKSPASLSPSQSTSPALFGMPIGGSSEYQQSGPSGTAFGAVQPSPTAESVRRPLNFLASTSGENAVVNQTNGEIIANQGPGTTVNGQYYAATASSGAYTVPPAQPSGSSLPSLGGSSGGQQGQSGAGYGPVYKATITNYGAGDSFGSGNCATSMGACGFMLTSGFACAVSEALYAVIGSGAAGGDSCRKCVKITGATDSSGAAITTNSIVLVINNLCPRQGNSLCAQSTLSDVNQLGANVNVDICQDSTHNGQSAIQAFFGNSNGGLAVGTAQLVPCEGNWQGTIGETASWAPPIPA
ncbi:MAG: hypothetical protein M1814_004484 [Vezdaea aestivalis]|nr:MAG: hypothetical protein M1814_004484 [Vezdaea aestivalis]